MKHLLTSIFILACMGVCVAFTTGTPSAKATNTQLTERDQAEAPFDVMMKVLTHKRCVNCHPNGDRPRQGEDSHYHNFNVLRGADNHGVAGLKCGTCHQSENNDYSGVPGAPEWSLAPIEMYWEGLSRTEIARSMTDPTKNGGRSIEELVKHLTEHELVLWAWEPGVDDEGTPREKPPVPVEEYIAAVKAWAAAGAIIPEK
ncbi:MAG: hypothetical protein AB8H12_23880 [Lewinella sp.]